MRGKRVARALVGMVLVGGAVTTIACGLVIDADELVADNGQPIPGAGEAGDDASSGDERVLPDPGDASVDGEAGSGIVLGCRNSATGSIPACVAAPPAGADLFAVVWGRVGTPLPCPAGYVTTQSIQGYADIEKAPPPCSSTGCSCGQGGTPACTGQVQYYSDNACAVPSTNNTLAGNACVRTDQSNNGSAALVFSLSGVTCGASGTSATKVDPATFCTEMHACRPDPNLALPACSPGQVATPPAAKARVCYRPTGACVAPYVAVPGFATSSQVTDTSACSCTCNLADGGCTGGSVDVFSNDNSCSNGSTGTLAPACRPRTDYQRSVRLKTNATPAAGPCTPAAQLTGALQLPPIDIPLCCLPE